jgi:plastocyanin
MRRTLYVASMAAVLTLGIYVLGRSHAAVVVSAQEKQQEEQPVKAVAIDNFSFTPATLTVAVGTTVKWTNRDDIPHTVVSTDDPRTFKSKVLDTDESFSFTFTKAGTFPYFCSIHPKMTAKVIVQAAGKH